MVELHLDGLTRRYDDVTALDDASLDVADGEFFSLVGPSGCGKTTTLRLVAGLESPTGGEIRFDDREMTGVPPEDRDVGLVFQNYALFPHMSVRENVAYGLRFRDPPAGVPTAERVTELLELVDLAGMGDRSPDQLSGGQQQRVALARALAPGPELLLLDEPMSALDARLRERLRVQVRDIQRELDITTLYVTHDQAEALAVSDRVAVLREGHVEQVGTPEQVYREPATRFVAGFVGDNNLLDGSVVAHETEGATVRVGDATFRVRDGAAGEQAGDASGGGDVTLAVRPEAISVDGGTNALTATVESVEFLGDAYRVHCRWGGRELLVKTPRAPDADELRLGFEPGDARVLR